MLDSNNAVSGTVVSNRISTSLSVKLLQQIREKYASSDMAMFTFLSAITSVVYRKMHPLHDRIDLLFPSFTKKDPNSNTTNDANLNALSVGADLDTLSFKHLLTDLKSQILHTFQFQGAHLNDPIDEFISNSWLIQYAPVHVEIEGDKMPNAALALSIAASGDCDLVFNPGKIHAEAVETLGTVFNNLLEQVLASLDQKVDELYLLNATESTELRIATNNGVDEAGYIYQIPDLLLEVFDTKVQNNPGQDLIFLGERTITYSEANAISNQLAHALLEQGVEKGRIIGSYQAKSEYCLLTMLAIWKAGGVYLPLDPGYPQDRIQHMLEDSQVACLVVGNNDIPLSYSGKFIELSEDFLQNYPTDAPGIFIGANDASYMIYTSGSTGKPKGVINTHGGLANSLKEYTDTLSLKTDDKLLQFASLSFDASVMEFGVAILSGAALVIADLWLDKGLDLFYKEIETNGITILQLTPSLIATLDMTKLPTVRIVVSVAEKAFFKDAMDVVQEGKVYYNAYGPSEVAICTAIHTFSQDKKELYQTLDNSIPIGKSLKNIFHYVLDAGGNILPKGYPGELYISGIGVSKGYLNRPELNGQKFLPNPFAEGKTYYRTGDLARWLPHGELEFLGRVDHQVKIRGYRIELGEIESVLEQLEGVQQSVVLAVENAIGEQELRVYYTGDQTKEILKARLSDKLPNFMVPRWYTNVNEIPVTPNGKVDRNALIAQYEISEESVPPANETEAKILNIWKEELERQDFGVKHNFFSLGGHSLKATVIASRISKELGKPLTVKNLFLHPEVRSLAQMLDQTNDNTKKTSSIQLAPEKDAYPLSSSQSRMFIVHQMEGVETAYNMPVFLKVEGKLEFSKVEEVVNALVERHESFRTRFWMREGVPVQSIEGKEDVPIEIERWEVEENNLERLFDEFVRPFDLGVAGLLRVGIARWKDGFILMMDLPHIISDGISMSILTHEFMELYNGNSLEPVQIQYKDFAWWLNQEEQQNRLDQEKEFWKKQLSGELPVLDVPTDFKRPRQQEFDGETLSFSIPGTLSTKIRDFSTQHNASVFHVFLAAYHLLLQKYSRQEDLISGIPVAGRNQDEIQQTIGMFVNTLPIRSFPTGEKTFASYLLEVRETVLEAMEHQLVPFELLLEELNLPNDPSRNPVFDVVFSYQNIPQSESHAEGLTFSSLENEGFAVAKFDLTLTVFEGKAFSFDLNFARSLFTKASIERLGKRYLKLLEQVLTDAHKKLDQYSVVLPEETELIRQFSVGKVSDNYSQKQSVAQLFNQSLSAHGLKKALIFDNEAHISYQDLNGYSNELADSLVELGVKKSDAVALLFDKSPEMVIAMLAVYKIGAICVPINPEFPMERINFLLKDAGSSTLVLQSEISVEGLEFDGLIQKVSSYLKFEGLPALNNINQLVENQNGDDVATILYTSGTTGQPKGVLIRNKSILRVTVAGNDYQLHADDVVLHTAAYGFDASLQEIWGALLNGATLVLPGKDDFMNPVKLKQLIDNTGVTFSFFTTSLFHQLIDRNIEVFENLSMVMTGGEVFQPEYANKLRSTYPNLKILNGYGPTEGTVYVSSYVIEDHCNGSIPIGTPGVNARVYLLDNENQPVGIGMPGEVVIAGDGISKGYQNRVELTKERFGSLETIGEEWVYRTGDLARWLPDGNMDFLGRKDQQVKIRGFRIELEEVERVFLEHENVTQVVVLPFGKNGTVHSMTAFVVTSEDSVELRNWMKRKVPAYMVPDFVVKVDEIPLNPNGKADKSKLRALVASVNPASDEEIEAAGTKTQEKLIYLFAEVLSVQSSVIGIQTSFFDLGGHSLKAMRLASMISDAFGKEIGLSQIFTHPDVKSLSELIDNQDLETEPITKINHQDRYETSFGQSRMWLASHMEGAELVYNMPILVDLKGKLDRDKLNETFVLLIERHESLRTRFEFDHGKLYQIIDPEEKFSNPITLIDQSGFPESEVEHTLEAFSTEPFDLQNGPLFKVKLLKLTDEYHKLLINMHHIVSDGWSMQVLLKEAVEIYTSLEKAGKIPDLPKLSIQYKDFASWQNKLVRDREADYLNFWKRKLEGHRLNTNLPYDINPNEQKSYHGAYAFFSFSKELSEALDALCKKLDVSRFVMIQALYSALIYRYTGMERVVTGAPFAGRERPELQHQIGFFLNNLPMVAKIQSALTFKEHLKNVRENSLEVFDHQAYPFDKLVEKLGPETQKGHTPLFDSGFTWQDFDHLFDRRAAEKSSNALQFEMNTGDLGIAKYHFWLFGMYSEEEGFKFNVEYNTGLYHVETVKLMGEQLEKIAGQITANPEITIGALELDTSPTNTDSDDDASDDADTSFEFDF